MKIKKTILLMLLSMSILGTSIFIYRKTRNITATNNPQLKQDYLDALHAQEVALWQNLTAKTGLTKNDCMPQNIQKNKREVDPRISSKTIGIVDEVLGDFGLDPATISLEHRTEGYPSPAFSSADTLFINEWVLSQYPDEAQKFVIGHEIQHILHNDTAIVEQLMNKTNLDYNEFSQRFGAFLRFIELRADITAMLHTKETYTKGALYFNKDLLDRFGDNNAPTHPTYSLRLETAQNILDQKPLQNNTLVA